MKIKHRRPVRPPEREEIGISPVKLCHEVSHLSRAKIRSFHESDDITSQHGTRLVLSFLAAGDGVTQRELVNATHMRPPTISVILKNLEGDGVVERKRDADDMRSIRVYLTPKGRELDRRNIEKIKRIDAMALSGLDERELEMLTELLSRIRDNLLKQDDEDLEDR